MDEKALKELLLKESEEFRRLAEQHRLCEEKLEVLRQKKAPLTEEEEMEERQLKKKKLVLKDRMYILMQERQKAR